MYCLLYRSQPVVFQVQNISGNAFKEKRYMKVTVKRIDRDKQWTDSRHSRPCAHLIHRITGVEGFFNLKPPPGENQPFHQLPQSAK